MKLVSAVMLTAGRPEYARKAVVCFMAQTYENRELIVVDDLNDRSFPNGSADLPLAGRSLYFLHSTKSIVEKRNLACGLTRGEIIMHWDDDDYSAPDRMADQVSTMEESGKQVSGYHSMLFYDQRNGRIAKYVGAPSYALGTSLCFTPGWWKLNQFRNGHDFPNVGEDNVFVRTANTQGELCSVDARQLMVARAHVGNTSAKDLGRSSFSAVPRTAIPEGFWA